jgi:endonuclease/exonuclease/phosphatase family metal-dependent hydrolase
LTLVAWNTHVGAGDIHRIVSDLRAGRLTAGRPVNAFVLLLQEVLRESDRVPASVPDGAKVASSIGRADPSREIERVSRALGLRLFYVPSMRNGNNPGRRQDRGNAILSTEPLEELTAIELPLERQRRVALAATVALRQSDGRVVRLRLVSVHLTNMVGHHAWLLSEAGRVRQARALARTIDNQTIVLGGDFNTWFGAWDGAYRELARRTQPPEQVDRRPTFALLRLDHFFTRLPDGWHFTVRRADDRYGSDHYPLIGDLRFGDRPR